MSKGWVGGAGTHFLPFFGHLRAQSALESPCWAGAASVPLCQPTASQICRVSALPRVCADSVGAPSSLPCLPRAPHVLCCLHFLWVWVLLLSLVAAWVLLMAVMDEWSPKSGFVCLIPAALPAALALQRVFWCSSSCCLSARLEGFQG